MFPFPSLTRCNADVGLSSKCWALLGRGVGVPGQARGLSYGRNLSPRILPLQEQCSAPASQSFHLVQNLDILHSPALSERSESASVPSCEKLTQLGSHYFSDNV
jgi:hypothetical protein